MCIHTVEQFPNSYLFLVKMLSMETPQHQGIYAPLNQAMSDSESEEEIHNSTKHRQIHRQHELFLQQQPQLNLNAKSRVPPNTLNLQPKSYQQNRRKLLIERQRQLDRNLYQNSQLRNIDSKHIGMHVNGFEYYVLYNACLLFSLCTSICVCVFVY